DLRERGRGGRGLRSPERRVLRGRRALLLSGRIRDRRRSLLPRRAVVFLASLHTAVSRLPPRVRRGLAGSRLRARRRFLGRLALVRQLPFVRRPPFVRRLGLLRRTFPWPFRVPRRRAFVRRF